MFLFSFDKSDQLIFEERVAILSDYEQGWADGYCEGWKDEKGQFAICPVTPICPVPKIECSKGYRCGYNRGFKYGICKARGGDCEK
ncbi:hypothetical protein [Gilvibacter sp.]|uniref:hypothetical protein n=1 Tax=Gilvibacter sp. TaxID=2729997 RepID=UPI003B521A51